MDERSFTDSSVDSYRCFNAITVPDLSLLVQTLAINWYVHWSLKEIISRNNSIPPFSASKFTNVCVTLKLGRERALWSEADGLTSLLTFEFMCASPADNPVKSSKIKHTLNTGLKENTHVRFPIPKNNKRKMERHYFLKLYG